MANLTFIVGNGLDVSLGLNTSYRDFYKYVQEHKRHPSNSIYEAIAKENPEWWADFELGLGKFTNTIETINEKERGEWSRKLNTELDDIKRDLKAYIKEQNERADEHIPNIKFERDSFVTGLEMGQVSNVVRHLNDGSATKVHFITLNYTNVLEKLFPSGGAYTVGRNYHVNDIHHIHGAIDRRISLGVNDETQISSYIDNDEKQFLIKPEIIRLMNDGRLDVLTDYINTSNVIVIFGASLGATDAYIWQRVIDWLEGNPNRLLVIHSHERELDVNDLTERESLLLNDRVKNKFLSYSLLSETSKDELKRRTYVIPNTTELFAIKHP